MHWAKEARLIAKVRHRTGTIRLTALELGISIGKVSEFCKIAKALERHPEIENLQSATMALNHIAHLEHIRRSRLCRHSCAEKAIQKQG